MPLAPGVTASCAAAGQWEGGSVDEKQAQAQAPAFGSGTAWVSGQHAQRSQLGPNQGIVEGRRAAGAAQLGHVAAR